MKALTFALAGTSLLLAACATTPGSEGPTAPPAAMECNAAPAQSLVGQRASAETGSQALRSTGARSLRWGPPRSAWTMDYRQDRVNVRYDDSMTITEVTCG